LKILVPKAPWSAVVPATAFSLAILKAAASLPHSNALRAFSWFQAGAGGMIDCHEFVQCPEEVGQKMHCLLIAWLLMPEHFHSLLKP
jgi:hypothetical protein